MRFADIRPTYFKQTPAAEGASESLATPRLLSPFKPPHEMRDLRKGVEYADLLQSTYNRAGRRRNRQTHPRKRFRDNHVQAHWLPVRKAQIALEKARAAKESAE